VGLVAVDRVFAVQFGLFAAMPMSMFPAEGREVGLEVDAIGIAGDVGDVVAGI
jgi:hypothetical protein